MLNPIPRDAVCSWTDKLGGLIDRIAAESMGALSAEEIWRRVASGEWFLAVVGKAETVLVLNEIEGEHVKVLEIVGVAGQSMDGWAQAAKELDSVARQRGVKRMRAEGRLAWLRVAPKFGWKATRVVVERELHDA